MCVVTNFSSDCRGFPCAASGSAMDCLGLSTPQPAGTGSREHVVSGVEKWRSKALWRGSPRATPPQSAIGWVLRRICLGVLVGVEGLDLGLGVSEPLKPFILVHGDATLLWFEMTRQEPCHWALEAQAAW